MKIIYVAAIIYPFIAAIIGNQFGRDEYTPVFAIIAMGLVILYEQRKNKKGDNNEKD